MSTFCSFWDFLTYVKEKNMCTTPGCTTCGCMPFRNFCKNEIGFRDMCELISTVSYREIEDSSPEYWYEPVRIIYDNVFPSLPTDNPLMAEYLRIRDILLKERSRRRLMAQEKVQAEQEQARLRREERQRKAQEHRERSEAKRLEYHRLNG